MCIRDRIGAVEMHYETVPGVSEAGEYNVWVDLFGCKFNRGDRKVQGLTEMAGLMEQKGAHIYLGEHRFHGQAALLRFLRDSSNSHVVQSIKASVTKWVQEGGM